jgi:hypothetical protein
MSGVEEKAYVVSRPGSPRPGIPAEITGVAMKDTGVPSRGWRMIYKVQYPDGAMDWVWASGEKFNFYIIPESSVRAGRIPRG